jgi:hypothetical protein
LCRKELILLWCTGASARLDDDVKSLAKEYLELALTYRCNWNYGNAAHDGNRYLGLVRLRNGNLEQAAAHLEVSGKTTGSPQLNSFGPDLDLADQLLKRGLIKPVEQYLVDINLFWKSGSAQDPHRRGKTNQRTAEYRFVPRENASA